MFAANRIEQILEVVAASDEREVFAFTDIDFIGSVGDAENKHPRTIAYLDLPTICDALPQDVWFLAGNPAISRRVEFSRSSREAVDDP